MHLTLRPSSTGRLDRWLLEELRRRHAPGLSRARIKEFFARKLVRLDGRVAEPSQELSDGGAYEIELVGLGPEDLQPPRAAASPRGAFLPIAHEDAGLLVLNKPSGIPSAPLSSEETETAVGAALAHDPAIAQAQIGRGGLEPGLLHRLDTGTSGLLAFARTQDSYEHYHRAWRERRVRKTYRAIAPALAALDRPRELRLWMGHDDHSAKKMKVIEGYVPGQAAAVRGIRGKPLETLTRIERITTQGALADYRIEIETGVMHQIRCTLAHLGAPILGDPIYGGASSERLWLHAWCLELPRPDGQPLSLQCELPPGWPLR
jgi:23S rRNA pseudouridine1911/1915/1917 synthase